MTIKDITFLKSIEPITLVDKPSDYTVETVSKILASNDYIQYKKLFQKAFMFPSEGISIKPFIGLYLNDPLNTISTNLMTAFQLGAYPI